VAGGFEFGDQAMGFPGQVQAGVAGRTGRPGGGPGTAGPFPPWLACAAHRAGPQPARPGTGKMFCPRPEERTAPTQPAPRQPRTSKRSLPGRISGPVADTTARRRLTKAGRDKLSPQGSAGQRLLAEHSLAFSSCGRGPRTRSSQRRHRGQVALPAPPTREIGNGLWPSKLPIQQGEARLSDTNLPTEVGISSLLSGLVDCSSLSG
jgi:hypothetical protein